MQEIKTQAELDEAIADGVNEVRVTAAGIFHIRCSYQIRVSVSATLSRSVRLLARGNSSVEARDSSSVVAWENSGVVARDSSSVEAWENSGVEAWDSSRVVARGNSSVVAWENSSVVARGKSSVEAWDSSSVEAWGNVIIRLFSALSIRASAYVTVLKHGSAKTLEGGRQLDAAPEPTTGKEWCEFNGINPATSNYRVQDIDARILEQIEARPGSFNMRLWHGSDCSAENWCETTHCRAGYAICLAGAAGFELERKYGPEIAGRMIYAVSRPDEPLPDFCSSNEEALADIRRAAGKAGEG